MIRIIFITFLFGGFLYSSDFLPYVEKKRVTYEGTVFNTDAGDFVFTTSFLRNTSIIKKVTGSGLRQVKFFPSSLILDICPAGNELNMLSVRNDSVVFSVMDRDFSELYSLALTEYSQEAEGNTISCGSGHILISAGSMLYIREGENISLVSGKLASDPVIANGRIFFLVSAEDKLVLNELKNGLISVISVFDHSTENKLLHNDKALFILSEFESSLHVTFMDLRQNHMSDIWLNTDIMLTDVHPGGLYAITDMNDRKMLTRVSFLPENKTTDLAVAPDDPVSLSYDRDGILIQNDEDITIFNVNGELISRSIYKARGPASDFSFRKDSYGFRETNRSVTFFLEKDDLWLVKKIFYGAGNYLVFIILFALIAYMMLKYRKAREWNKSLTDLPSMGLLFIIDKNGKLKELNKGSMEMLDLTPEVPLNRYYDFYFVKGSLEPLKEIIAKALELKENFAQKFKMTTASGVQDYYTNVAVLTSRTGTYNGLIVTAMDITEELERQRLNNWAQLAHDMQTNLSTIRLNAQQLAEESEGMNLSRVQKIVHQSNLLMNRVRDIITVGRTERINKTKVSSIVIFEELVSEFDLEAHPDVSITHSINEFFIRCDKAKIIRALRNMLENSLKAMHNTKGTIAISFYADFKYSYFSIADQGKGMDKATREKMLTPFFTTADNSGGTGIGTMIMQNVVEQHGGEIIISSEIGKGTQIIVKIPNV